MTAMQIQNEFPGDAMLSDFKAWMALDPLDPDQLDHRTMLNKKLKLSKKPITLPPEFPDHRVEESFLKPVVERSRKPFHWGEPDAEGIREFCERKLSWTPEYTDKQLLPVLNRVVARRSAQPSITAFMGPASNAEDHQAPMRPSLKAAVRRLRKQDLGEDTSSSDEEEPDAAADGAVDDAALAAAVQAAENADAAAVTIGAAVPRSKRASKKQKVPHPELVESSGSSSSSESSNGSFEDVPRPASSSSALASAVPPLKLQPAPKRNVGPKKKATPKGKKAAPPKARKGKVGAKSKAAATPKATKPTPKRETKGRTASKAAK
jgi:hypothetical protein